MQEIERKFLVTSDAFLAQTTAKIPMIQAYLNTHPERTVRVRIQGDTAFLTIKGKSTSNGISRFEWEKEISVSEAEHLLPLCEPGQIHKIRHLVPIGSHTYEVDLFDGNHKGLVLAEIELQEETETFILPDWLGKEVTNDLRFYNSYLSKHDLSSFKGDF